MKNILGLAGFAIAMGLAMPVQAQSYGGGGGRNADNAPIMSTSEDANTGSNKVRNDPEGIAEDLRLKGRCDQALPILRRIADTGSGYAISQYNLGLCLFDLAKAEHDAAHAAEQRQEGATWILEAANAGFAKAQARAVVMYLDGTGIAADPVEAAKWALLYHGNSMRMAIGLRDIAPDVSSRLDAALDDAKREEAQSRADAWQQTAQREQ